MSEQSTAVRAVRTSHERFAGLVTTLGDDDVTKPSYAADWSIAQVASHLGSQAEIFGLFIDAGLDGVDPPGGDVFREIWARWDAMEPMAQVNESVAANERLVARLEETARSGQPFTVDLFNGPQDLDGLARTRLAEHAVHTWDVAVALDRDATVAPDAVDLLLDVIPGVAAYASTPVEGADPVVVGTTSPRRRYEVTLSPEVGLTASDEAVADDSAGADLELPAEAFVRLVYGRLDEQHTPDSVRGDARLAALRQAFPGF